MTLLKDSEKYEEIKKIHTKIWNILQDNDELYAKSLLNECLESLNNKPSDNQSTSQKIKEYLRSPIIWFFIAVGLLIVPLLGYLLIWILVQIE